MKFRFDYVSHYFHLNITTKILLFLFINIQVLLLKSWQQPLYS